MRSLRSTGKRDCDGLVRYVESICSSDKPFTSTNESNDVGATLEDYDDVLPKSGDVL